MVACRRCLEPENCGGYYQLLLKLKPSVLQPLLVFISCPEQQTTVAPCSCSKRHNWATIFGFSLEWGNYTTNMTPFTVDSISPPVSHPPVGWVWWAVDVTGTCSLLCQKTYSNSSICAFRIIHFICIILCHFIHVSPSDSSLHVANQVDDHFSCKKRTKKNEICKASIWLT